ncbi:HIG1 domain-containing protein [Trichostrongylus colubriformis]|uniref:HIG1 domain-containing protein n=1 Tax=Trichostrongylus colubriformis TaxID=6319 RepID=A0AAN8FTP6_TRICO
MGIFDFFKKSPPSPAIQENEEEGVMVLINFSFSAFSLSPSAFFLQIPSVPRDIRFSGGKEIKGIPESGIVSKAASNPGVILGIGLTSLALLGMFRHVGSSLLGDKFKTQKFMQYRVAAQLFTVTALVAGVALYAMKPPEEVEKQSGSKIHQH